MSALVTGEDIRSLDVREGCLSEGGDGRDGCVGGNEKGAEEESMNGKQV